MATRIRQITDHEKLFIGQKMMLLRHLELYPTGILSEVMDTWDLWQVLTELLPDPKIKAAILARDGKLVIRPDSGDPVDIICGIPVITEFYLNEELPSRFIYENEIYSFNLKHFREVLEEYGINDIDQISSDIKKCQRNVHCIEKIQVSEAEQKGVIELLWDSFGGKINEHGYKELDSHIGAIYGDSITLDRATAICERLKAKGFASTNVVLGIGSYTYQYNTRDTFGFAVKATYGELTTVQQTEGGGYNEVIETREIFKDPITDDGTKKSLKGLLRVYYVNGQLAVADQCNWKEEDGGELQTVFEDGKLVREQTLEDIRLLIKQQL